MSHPVVWPSKIYFYPIGNTSAVCLTRDISPDEPASMLLLGCGDLRNILYTICADTTRAERRLLDFTCCDMEPGVLARNILIFTLIMDGHEEQLLWNIFYHFKIDKDSMSVLRSQSKRLADMSKTLDAWKVSPYSNFLFVCSQNTLLKLHQYWSFYANYDHVGNAGKAQRVLEDYRRVHHPKKIAVNYSTSRSAGFFSLFAAFALTEYFSDYWNTGTVFRQQDDLSRATLFNPTFLYSVSGEGWRVHYGTDPLGGFHLAEAYAHVLSPKEVTRADLIKVAMTQFHRWCVAFKAAVKADSVRLRIFAGDAIALCHALRDAQTISSNSYLYTSAWCGTLLLLDGGEYANSHAPSRFDVIDTSNILDHLGLMNVLIAASPLLRQNSSCLYTERLRLPDGTGDPIDGLQQQLCASIPTISLLLGVTPSACLTNFTSFSNMHELMFKTGTDQFHERTMWRSPILVGECADLLPVPSFEPVQLAKLLFDIYYNMFKGHENMQDRMRQMASLSSSCGGVRISEVFPYHRVTIVTLLGLVKSRVNVNWDTMMEHLFVLLHEENRLMLHSNYYQELCCQLFIRGIYCVDALRPGPNSVTGQIARAGIFRQWRTIPAVVCVVLLIPRDKIRSLEELDAADELGSPTFQLDLMRPTVHNRYSSIRITFGTMTAQGTGENATVSIEEDLAGLRGRSPLIVSAWIPAFNLDKSSDIEVAFSVNAPPRTLPTLMRKLGPRLILFSAKVHESNFVKVVSTSPNLPAEVETMQSVAPLAPSTQHPLAFVDTGTEIWTLKRKWNASNNANREALSNRAKTIQSVQTSACSVNLQIGSEVRVLVVYPAPIDNDRVKLRVARTSGFVEVIVPIYWPPPQEGGLAPCRVPIHLGGNNTPSLLNLHRVNLDFLPSIKELGSVHKSVVNPLVSLAFSDRETQLRERESDIDVLVNVKDTIHALFNRACEKHQLFALSDPAGDGIWALIFLNCLRLDVASHTMVADAGVLVLTLDLVEKYGQRFANFGPNIVQIATSEKEVLAWKYLLPAFAERCRIGWSHRTTCEYVRSGITRSVEKGRNALCSCGEGRNLGQLSNGGPWKDVSSLMTRVAICPLFAVSYLEKVDRIKEVLGQMEDKLNDEGCYSCGKKSSKLLKCSRCKVATYCSKDCQLADWKSHKTVCQQQVSS